MSKPKNPDAPNLTLETRGWTTIAIGTRNYNRLEDRLLHKKESWDSAIGRALDKLEAMEKAYPDFVVK